MTNPIEQYIIIQQKDADFWYGTPSRFALTENQQAHARLVHLRKEYPEEKFRPVSISVTLLAAEESN